MPVDKIWTSTNVLDSKKLSYVTTDDIRALLSQTKVSFVVANVGDKLKWVDLDNCFNFWKSEVQMHIADKPEHIDLETFPDNYAYVASRWTSDTQPIILLEKFH